jgi:hypothetical protein
MTNNFQLGICEIYHPSLYGFTENSYPFIHNHIMIYLTIDNDDFFDSTHYDITHNLLYYYLYFNRRQTLINHPTVRNYHNITNNINNVKLDIIQIIELSGNELTACIKTIWLKLLQRKWRRILKEREYKILKLKNFRILRKREITGRNY